MKKLLVLLVALIALGGGGTTVALTGTHTTNRAPTMPDLPVIRHGAADKAAAAPTPVPPAAPVAPATPSTAALVNPATATSVQGEVALSPTPDPSDPCDGWEDIDKRMECRERERDRAAKWKEFDEEHQDTGSSSNSNGN